jgi:hypothetical protein
MMIISRIICFVGIVVLAYVIFFSKPREIVIEQPAEPPVEEQGSKPQPTPPTRPKPRIPQPVDATPVNEPGQPIFRSLQQQPKPAQSKRPVVERPRVYEWEETSNAALMEKDRSKLQERIDAAQTAINRRLEEIKLNPRDDSSEERVAIRNAQLGLNLLREEVSNRTVVSRGGEPK